MSNSKINEVYNKSIKDNFVVMYENINHSKEKNARLKNYNDGINLKKIIEYTDDVAELMRKLYEKITLNLEDYFLGKNDIIDISNKLKNNYISIKNYCVTSELCKENNEAYKCKILKDIYRNYRYNTVIAAVNINDIEGRKIASDTTGTDKDLEEYYVYYNSDYYFKCGELREALKDIVEKLAVEEKITTFDIQTIDNRKRYVYDYGFNYAWSWSNKINFDSGVRINKNLIPPENIKVFYIAYIDANKDNKVTVNFEGNNIEANIKAKEQLDQSNINILELLDKKSMMLFNDTKLKDFLESFYVFSKEDN
ncbi:MAG: hypothetical protein ACERKZ_04320 [Lachnotalea sp.]